MNLRKKLLSFLPIILGLLLLRCVLVIVKEPESVIGMAGIPLLPVSLCSYILMTGYGLSISFMLLFNSGEVKSFSKVQTYIFLLLILQVSMLLSAVLGGCRCTPVNIVLARSPRTYECLWAFSLWIFSICCGFLHRKLCKNEDKDIAVNQ